MGTEVHLSNQQNEKKEKGLEISFSKLSKRGKTLVIFVFIVMILGFGAFVLRETVVSVNSHKMEAENLAILFGSEIERDCSRTFQLNGIMEALLFADDGAVADFQKLAKHLLPDYPAASCVQLAPDGIVSDVYPLEGNESVLGHNLFMDANRSHEAVLTRNSGVLTIGGPYQLKQGGVGFIGRLPVFLDSEKTEFWGFINVVVLVSNILDALDFTPLSKHGYDFSIYKIDDETDDILHIYGTDYENLNNPVRHELDMPNARWDIAVSPKNSWIDIRLFVVLVVMSLLLILTLLFLAILIVQQYSSNRELARLAVVDQLTGLFSRQTAVHTLEEEIEKSSRTGLHIAMCFIDMNDFKEINDTYGHTKGDSALKWVASQLNKVVRQDDVVARFGGDEFIVIFRGQYTDNYIAMAERIRKALNAPADLGNGVVINISAAVGVAFYPDNGKTVESLVQYADDAMYKEKAQMKACIR